MLSFLVYQMVTTYKLALGELHLQTLSFKSKSNKSNFPIVKLQLYTYLSFESPPLGSNYTLKSPHISNRNSVRLTQLAHHLAFQFVDPLTNAAGHTIALKIYIVFSLLDVQRRVIRNDVLMHNTCL